MLSSSSPRPLTCCTRQHISASAADPYSWTCLESPRLSAEPTFAGQTAFPTQPTNFSASISTTFASTVPRESAFSGLRSCLSSGKAGLDFYSDWTGRFAEL